MMIQVVIQHRLLVFFFNPRKTVAPIDLQTKQMRKQLAKRLRDWFQCSTGVVPKPQFVPEQPCLHLASSHPAAQEECCMAFSQVPPIPKCRPPHEMPNQPRWLLCFCYGGCEPVV